MIIILMILIPIAASAAFVIGATIGINRGWADGRLAFRRYCVRTYGDAWTDARLDAEGNPK